MLTTSWAVVVEAPPLTDVHPPCDARLSLSLHPTSPTPRKWLGGIGPWAGRGDPRGVSRRGKLQGGCVLEAGLDHLLLWVWEGLRRQEAAGGQSGPPSWRGTHARPDPGLCAAEGRLSELRKYRLPVTWNSSSRSATAPPIGLHVLTFPGAPSVTGHLHCVLPSTLTPRTECVNRKTHQMPEPGRRLGQPPALPQDCAGDVGQ